MIISWDRLSRIYIVKSNNMVIDSGPRLGTLVQKYPRATVSLKQTPGIIKPCFPV
jgi:hypothetical protein